MVLMLGLGHGCDPRTRAWTPKHRPRGWGRIARPACWMWLSVSLGCAAGGVYSDVDEATRLTLRAQEEYQLGQYMSAAAIYERALAIQESVLPRDDIVIARLVTNLGLSYRASGDLERAEPLLRRAQQADPTSTRIYVTLVSEYQREGRTPEVIEVYESWLRVDPEQAGVKNNLAWLLASVEEPTPWDLDRALELARGAREGMPESPIVADTLGWVRLRQDRPQAAVALFQESVAGHAEGSAERAAVRYRLAQAYERAGDPDRSIQELEAALIETAVFQERPAAVTLLARLRTERGQVSSAAAHRATP